MVIYTNLVTLLLQGFQNTKSPSITDFNLIERRKHMIDEEFVTTHLENRIKSLTKERLELASEQKPSLKYWVISGIISGLEEALELIIIS
jgi:hypothetical protein